MNKKIVFALIGVILIIGVITSMVLAKSNNNTNVVESVDINSTKTNSVKINQTNIDSSYTINDNQIEDIDDNLYDEALELPSCCY